jgi:HSP20 family protein
VAFSLIPSTETTELADDIRELFEELSRTLRHGQRAYSGECHPSLDVLESDTTIEVIVDVAGVAPDAIRILFRGGVLVIAGEKAPYPTSDAQTFHLVEREFGRFARAVRLTGAFDIDGTKAALRDGELRIVLPKLEERRGRPHRIAIAPAHPRTGAP